MEKEAEIDEVWSAVCELKVKESMRVANRL